MIFRGLLGIFTSVGETSPFLSVHRFKIELGANASFKFLQTLFITVDLRQL